MLPPVLSEKLDLAIAVAVGPAYWGWAPRTALDGAAAVTSTTLVLVVLTSTVRGLVSQDDGTGAIALTAAAVLAAAIWLAAGLHDDVVRLPLPAVAVGRILAVTALVGLWGAAHGNRLNLLQVWPLGAAIGLDAALTMRTLGQPLHGRALLARFATSATHLGVVVGLLALVLLDLGRVDPDTALRLYLGVLANIVLAAVAISLVARGAAAERHLRRTWEADQAQRMANWIHDDMCGLLIPVRTAIRAGNLTGPEEILDRLDAVDFELRELQVAHTATHRTLQLADLLQLWGRRVQGAGRLLEAPTWEQCQIPLDRADADRLGRVLGVAVPNALAAGATRVRITVDEGTGPTGPIDPTGPADRTGPAALTGPAGSNGPARQTGPTGTGEAPATHLLHVSDDAGGFDATTLPPGRGLDRLLRDHPEVRLTSTNGRTLLTVPFGTPPAPTTRTAPATPTAPTTPAPPTASTNPTTPNTPAAPPQPDPSATLDPTTRPTR